MNRFHSCIRRSLLVLLVLAAGCSSSRQMMPTPNLHTDDEQDFYTGLAPELQSTEVPLFYVTDRAPETDEKGNLRYGYQRSKSVAFGTAIVELGKDITWEQLVEASRTQQRLAPVKLKVRDVTEVVRGPSIPLPYREENGRIVEHPEMAAERAAAKEAFRKVLVEKLALTPRKEVFLFVHGYHNTFDDAAFTMGELWHFLGRIGVPMIYTWPAGYPGLFGYTYDRESSEFTVYHLRSFLKLISSYPEVEKIHLIAHSRGTDVATAAVRELTIESRGAGKDPRDLYKIHNLILAAPDLDLEVASQRIVGDRIPLSVRRLTVYSSPEDKAIGIASRLFASPRGRLGTFGQDDISGPAAVALEYSNANLAFVNFEPAVDLLFTDQGYGHSYFRDAPTVASDVVLMLRNDLDPGEGARQLKPLGAHLWGIPQGYPRVGANE